MITHRKVGGIHFIKLGRLTISWSIKRKPAPARIVPNRRMALAVRRLNAT